MKRTALLIGLLLLLVLSGCAAPSEFISNRIRDKSSLQTDSAYQTYQQQLEQGLLDADGYYEGEIPGEDMIIPAGTVAVQLGTNSNFKIVYYTDADLMDPVSENVVYLRPGASLYAEVSMALRVSSNQYHFNRFDIYQYEAGERYLNEELISDFDSTGIVLTIPTNYDGDSLSVMPTGRYSDHEIALSDYYIDDDGEKHELDGTWNINSVACEEETCRIDAKDDYIVSYRFAGDDFFFVSATPATRYVSNDSGMVTFKQCEAESGVDAFEIELKPTITVELDTNKGRQVSIDGAQSKQYNTGEHITISGLRYGQRITIVTNVEWPELTTSRNPILISESTQGDGIHYQLLVAEQDGAFLFDPNEYQYEHGTIAFTCFGEEVTNQIPLPKGTPITYEMKNAEEGYWLQHGIITVGEEDETRRKLEQLAFSEMGNRTIYLLQPEAGGTIRYSIDGVTVSDTVIEVACGTTITIDYIPWTGWNLSSLVARPEMYMVSSDDVQYIFQSTAANKVFVEDEWHKPALTITLEKSVGEDMEFQFSAYSLDDKDYNYESNWFRKDYRIISEKDIGSAKPITITTKNRAIAPGQALRVIVMKTNEDGKTTTTIRYYDDLTKPIDPVDIYPEEELAEQDYVVKSIAMSIGIVDVVAFEPPTVPAHVSVTVKRTEDKKTLQSGDYIETNDEITISIKAENGYYISGKGVENDAYKTKLKYSRYVSDIDDLIAQHPAKPFYTITLDASDSFATYTYTVDGSAVKDTISVKAGQKLKLIYQITEAGYELKNASSGILGLGKNSTKATEEITIQANMDGKTITKADFGIETVKGG